MDQANREQEAWGSALKNAFGSKDAETAKALVPILLEHRDFIYRERLELPVEL